MQTPGPARAESAWDVSPSQPYEVGSLRRFTESQATLVGGGAYDTDALARTSVEVGAENRLAFSSARVGHSKCVRYGYFYPSATLHKYVRYSLLDATETL